MIMDMPHVFLDPHMGAPGYETPSHESRASFGIDFGKEQGPMPRGKSVLEIHRGVIGSLERVFFVGIEGCEKRQLLQKHRRRGAREHVKSHSSPRQGGKRGYGQQHVTGCLHVDHEEVFHDEVFITGLRREEILDASRLQIDPSADFPPQSPEFHVAPP